MGGGAPCRVLKMKDLRGLESPEGKDAAVNRREIDSEESQSKSANDRGGEAALGTQRCVLHTQRKHQLCNKSSRMDSGL